MKTHHTVCTDILFPLDRRLWEDRKQSIWNLSLCPAHCFPPPPGPEPLKILPQHSNPCLLVQSPHPSPLPMRTQHGPTFSLFCLLTALPSWSSLWGHSHWLPWVMLVIFHEYSLGLPKSLSILCGQERLVVL